MIWNTWFVRFEAELSAGSLSGETRRLRSYHLRRFAYDHPDLPPGEVTRDLCVSWLAGHQWSAETTRSYRASLRRFFAWAYASGLIAADPTATLPTIRPPRALPRPAPDEIVRAAVIGAPERTRLMIELISATGIRRGECARVHSRDVSEDLVGWSLRVVGKGGHVRMVPLPGRLAGVLRGAEGFMFPGRIDGHLSPRRVGELVAEALPGTWTAHTLRHRYATRAYAVSHDLRAVQELLGHAKPETTAIYTRVADTRLREVAAQVWAAA
ncbi:tyrosine-type recombinase/integrase [Gordonia sp. CPCC 205333]|uniref:tyrosine-type recombinase/integrase n=1 Tax=Gordonia sp. CPCC 205333 TaxID=3140790 RepID=UPI003AF401DE